MIQAPGLTRMAEPTCGSPAITGAVVLTTPLSRKWMKPLGQSPLMVMSRQSKSLPQLDSETTISVGETIRST